MYISGVRAAKLLAYNLVIKYISVILAFSLSLCYQHVLPNVFIIFAILFGIKRY